MPLTHCKFSCKEGVHALQNLLRGTRCRDLTAQLGRSVATAGDVDGDGFSDVIVGAPAWSNDEFDEGRAEDLRLCAGRARGQTSDPEPPRGA